MPETRIIIHPQMRNVDLLSNLPGLLDQTAQLRALHTIWYGMDHCTELAAVVVREGFEYFCFSALLEGIVCCLEDYG